MRIEREEKRRHKRYVVSGLRARLQKKRLFGLLKSVPTSKEYPCLDISESGMQLATMQKFTPKNKIILDISIPTTRNNPILAKAEVVWFDLSEDLNFARVGLQIVSMSKQDYANLKRLIVAGGREKDKVHPFERAKKMKEDSLFIKMHR